MAPTLRFNEEDSKDIFYRIQKPNSGTTVDPVDEPDIKFLAGACVDKLPTQEFKPEDQKSIVEKHSHWSRGQVPSPLISTTQDEEWALNMAKTICKTENLTLDQINIAVICPGSVAPTSRKMEYYHWADLAQGLGANIVEKSKTLTNTCFSAASRVKRYSPMRPYSDTKLVRICPR